MALNGTTPVVVAVELGVYTILLCFNYRYLFLILMPFSFIPHINIYLNAAFILLLFCVEPTQKTVRIESE